MRSGIDPGRVVPDDSRTLREGAIAAFGRRGSVATATEVSRVVEILRVNPDTPWRDLPEEQRNTILYGSAISDGNQHLHENLPILVAGRGGGAIASGRHLRVDDKTPITNLYRSMLDNVGVRTEKFGDSTGKLDALFKGAA